MTQSGRFSRTAGSRGPGTSGPASGPGPVASNEAAGRPADPTTSDAAGRTLALTRLPDASVDDPAGTPPRSRPAVAVVALVLGLLGAVLAAASAVWAVHQYYAQQQAEELLGEGGLAWDLDGSTSTGPLETLPPTLAGVQRRSDPTSVAALEEMVPPEVTGYLVRPDSGAYAASASGEPTVFATIGLVSARPEPVEGVISALATAGVVDESQAFVTVPAAGLSGQLRCTDPTAAARRAACVWTDYLDLVLVVSTSDRAASLPGDVRAILAATVPYAAT